jgi:dihydrofolate reductase
VQKFVVSSTMTDPQWHNSTVLSGDPVAEVRALKQQPGKDIVVTGSITLCHAHTHGFPWRPGETGPDGGDPAGGS